MENLQYRRHRWTGFACRSGHRVKYGEFCTECGGGAYYRDFKVCSCGHTTNYGEKFCSVCGNNYYEVDESYRQYITEKISREANEELRKKYKRMMVKKRIFMSIALLCFIAAPFLFFLSSIYSNLLILFASLLSLLVGYKSLYIAYRK